MAQSSCDDFSTRFVNENLYDHSIALEGTGGSSGTALFQYTVDEHNVVGRLAINSPTVGYLAVGFAGPNGGMAGANVLLGSGGNVAEYVIHETIRDFSAWSTPYVYDNPNNGNGDFVVEPTSDGCYVAMTFDFHYICGRHMSIEATDTFVWAANLVDDSTMSTHGANRGSFVVDWTAIATPLPPPVPRPAPQPLPVPRPAPQPLPVPRPVPQPLPVPRPVPQPLPVPRPVPQPLPVPRPVPLPLPVPRPVPQPLPVPRPVPQPLPVPRPVPQPLPVPRPVSPPVVLPVPRPAPQSNQVPLAPQYLSPRRTATPLQSTPTESFFPVTAPMSLSKPVQTPPSPRLDNVPSAGVADPSNPTFWNGEGSPSSNSSDQEVLSSSPVLLLPPVANISQSPIVSPMATSVPATSVAPSVTSLLEISPINSSNQSNDTAGPTGINDNQTTVAPTTSPTLTQLSDAPSATPSGYVVDRNDATSDPSTGALDQNSTLSPLSLDMLLPEYPRNDSLCSDFAVLFNDTENIYQKNIALNDGKGAMFSITLDDHDMMGRLAYNGIFGYLAFGYAGPDPNTPMLGAHIILAMSGSNYTVDDGFDLTDNEPYIQEYVVNDTLRDFVHWQAPHVYTRKYKGDIVVNTTDDGCYTVLTFKIHYIAGQHFNDSGIDTFIWAANDVDSYMMHHGLNRGIFSVDWNSFNASAEANNDSNTKEKAATRVSAVSGSLMLMNPIICLLWVWAVVL